MNYYLVMWKFEYMVCFLLLFCQNKHSTDLPNAGLLGLSCKVPVKPVTSEYRSVFRDKFHNESECFENELWSSSERFYISQHCYTVLGAAQHDLHLLFLYAYFRSFQTSGFFFHRYFTIMFNSAVHSLAIPNFLISGICFWSEANMQMKQSCFH